MRTTLLVFLATHYLTYVVTRSSFPPVERVRENLVLRAGRYQEPTVWTVVSYLSTCAWCAALYVAALVVLTTDVVVGDLAEPALLALASASFTGLTQTLVDRLERP